MQRILLYFLPVLVACGPLAYANDKSSTYQLGTYITSSAVADGTITDNFNCGDPSVTGTTVCSGGVADNQVMIYRIRVAEGIWSLETYRQASDSAVRKTFGDQPPHLKHEKENPLDFLKNGDRGDVPGRNPQEATRRGNRYFRAVRRQPQQGNEICWNIFSVHCPGEA